MATTIIKSLEVDVTKFNDKTFSPAKAMQLQSESIVLVRVNNTTGSLIRYAEGKRYDNAEIISPTFFTTVETMADLFLVSSIKINGVIDAGNLLLNANRVISIEASNDLGSAYIKYNTGRRYDPMLIEVAETPADLTTAINTATDIVIV